VRLPIFEVLGSANGDQRRLGETVQNERHRVCDRKGISIEKHQQVAVVSLMRDLHCQIIELAGMTPCLVDHAIEVLCV
jgi:hypothetical protein